MKRKKLLSVIVLSIAALFGACSEDDFQETIGLCPEVSATSPANGETSVALNKVITVTFNKEMNPSTINATSFTIVNGTTSIPGIITYSGNTASFTPTVNLVANKTYIGKVTTAVKDLDGNAMLEDFIWTFSTGTTLQPLVISTDPASNETGVVLNKIITATFNTAMNPTTINGTSFTLKQGTTSIAGVVSYSGTTASFVPTLPLSINTVYTATITTGVQNVSGIALSSDYVWNFTTGTLTAPIVMSTDPLNSETGVALNKIITASFNMPMDPSTISGTTFMVKIGTNSVSGTVSYIGTTATFTPSSNLSNNTTYTATITTGAKNLAGVSIANNYVWTFNTNTTASTPFVNLGSVERFGIIAGVGVSNNAGFSEIHNMDVGISPGVRSSISGFPPAIVVNGAIYASDDLVPTGVAAMLIQAKQDLTNAYLFAEGATSPAPATVSGDQGGLTLAPGIYKSTSTLLIQSGDLTLDAQGDPNAVWIFQIASDFTTVGGAGGSIILSGGAQAKNVFWQVGSSATIGNGTAFKGNVLALTSITMGPNATAVGRMLARNGSVVMTSTNIIDKP
ncbi:MAG: Ig-like domain-containing protein [Bacteroidota bacterium]